MTFPRLATLVLVAALCAWPAQAFDRAGWIADFEQIKAAMTARSPNLEWAAARGMDLPALEARTRQRLAEAGDDVAAWLALDRFVEDFGDGHMYLTRPSPAAAAQAPAAAPAPPSICASLGYRNRPDPHAIGARLSGYRAVSPGPDLPAGLVDIGGRKVGVLRISLFASSERQCDLVLKELKVPPEGPCDDACLDRVSRAVDAAFIRDAEDRLAKLLAEKPDALLVDVAGNGGGNDSSIVLARMLGDPSLKTPAAGFVREPARAKDLEEDATYLLKESKGARGEEARAVQGWVTLLKRGQAEATQPCDLSPLWRGEAVACTQLIRGFYAGGLVADELPASWRERPWADLVSSPARFPQPRVRWRGPLIVLVDHRSASSTELFAAMIQNGGRGIILGAPSSGAGCGWNLPREEVVLRHSGGRFTMPNCIRFKPDGRNEIDGIEPDVLAGLRTTDSPQQRAQRVGSRLTAAVDAAIALDRVAPK